MSKKLLFSITAVSIPFLGGCTSFSPRDVEPNPSEVTISRAFADIGLGLAALREASGDKPFGFQACDMTVTLALSVSADDKSKLTVDATVKADASIPAITPTSPSGTLGGSVNTNAELAAASAANRVNTINVRLVNLACMPKGVLAADNAKEYLEFLKNPELRDRVSGPFSTFSLKRDNADLAKEVDEIIKSTAKKSLENNSNSSENK